MKTRLVALALGDGLQVMRLDELKIGWLRSSESRALPIRKDEKLWEISATRYRIGSPRHSMHKM